jgi:hypothetical protein
LGEGRHSTTDAKPRMANTKSVFIVPSRCLRLVVAGATCCGISQSRQ